MIKANSHKYSVSAMCRVLQVNRSTYYYEAATKKDESELTADIQEIFRKSRNHYGTRKIKKELADCGKQVSRRRIGRIMKQEGLISSYTTAQFKPQKDRCNKSKVANVLNRQFQNQPYRNVVVSDLTYVRVGNRWNYICVLIDLFNREIIGYSAGEHKTAELVKQAFMKVDGNLSEIHIFHTDRGNEFKNETIKELLETFHMERSLSHKGCPYDNAVAEATFKIIKTEFVWNETFHTQEELKIKLWDYVNWYNHHRIHSSLGYQTPVQYRKNNLKNLSEKVLTIQVNAYADLVQKAIKKHGINKIKGKKCIVRTNQTDICGYRDKEAVEAVCGTVSRILTDAIIINTDSGEEVCILMIDIKSIDEAWEVHKSVSEELCNDMIEYNSRCSSNAGNIENREGDLKTVTGFSAVDED